MSHQPKQRNQNPKDANMMIMNEMNRNQMPHQASKSQQTQSKLHKPYTKHNIIIIRSDRKNVPKRGGGNYANNRGDRNRTFIKYMASSKAKDVNNNIRYLRDGGGGGGGEAECGESGGRRHGQRPEKVAPAAGSALEDREAAEEDGRRGGGRVGSAEEGGGGEE